MAVLGRKLPLISNDKQCVRAEFIRFLLLGGDKHAPVHESGLQLAGAYVHGALNLDNCTIPFGVVLLHCYFEESISATDAKLDGLFVLNKSYLADGLIADRFNCSASAILREVTTNGVVSLAGANIDGEVACDGASFSASEGEALSLTAAKISKSLNLRDGFKAAGEVQLLGASIGGNFDCTNGHFDGRGGVALAADGASINGDMYLCDGFSANGEVRLLGGLIRGDVDCSSGKFRAHENNALSADRIKIKGGLSLNASFHALGTVRILGASIEGNLACNGGCVEVSQGKALTAYRANILGSVFLRGGFKANGTIDLMGANIGGDFSCSQVLLNPIEGNALSLKSAVVRGIFLLKGLKQPARIDMSHADIGVLDDDLNAWGMDSELDGFLYGALGGKASTSGKVRLEWLDKQPQAHLAYDEFRPQPWRQTQHVLREMGHTEDAKQVGIAFEEHLRKIGRMGQWPNDPCDLPHRFKGMVTRSAHYIFGKLAGYGYRPVNLVMWMFAVWVACAAAYWFLALPPHSAIAPSDPLVFQNQKYQECRPDHQVEPGNWYQCEKLHSEYATFSPLAYSLDLMLPVVDLGQEKAWGAYIPSPSSEDSWWEELFLHWHAGHVARLISWFQILFGWVSSLLLVAIISGFSRRNDES